MTGINSDSGAAKTIALSITSSLDLLNQKPAITKDTSTTVAGNTKAQQAIVQMIDFNTSLIQVIGEASNHILRVASEFEAVDHHIAMTDSQSRLP